MAETSVEVKSLTEDFIAFDWEEEADSADDEPSFSAPALTVGQTQLYTKGRKRTADEMEAETGYSKKQRIAAESRESPWASSVDWDNCENAADMLNQEVYAFVDYVSPTPEEHETRMMIVEWIRRTVVAEFPDCQLVPFGSFATKLYLPTGDIDLVVSSPSIQKSGDIKSTLYRLAYILRRSNITDHVEVLAKTKVPIVKFVTSHGRFPVDISINQINGVGAVEIVHHFLAELPALRPLVLIVKSFLSQRSMNEVFTGGLGSYSITCMVTSFLQMHPKIRHCAIDPMDNLGVLLVEFFETYGKFFQYDHVGISLRAGGHYFRKRQRGWSNPNSPGLLTIEDPQDPTNDISGGSYGFMRVRQTLQGAFEMLSAALCIRGTELLERRHDGDNSPARMSLLGSIMGITQETMARRRLVADLYLNGALHRILDLPVKSLPSAERLSSRRDEQRRRRDDSPRRHGHGHGHHTRYHSRSRSPPRRRSPSPKRDHHVSHHHHRRTFTPPRDRAEAERGSRRDLDYDDGDVMWDEASRGAQETVKRRGRSLSSSDSSNSSVAHGDRHSRAGSSRRKHSDSDDGGRYGISGSRSKQQNGGKRRSPSSESGPSKLVVTYVGESDVSNDHMSLSSGEVEDDLPLIISHVEPSAPPKQRRSRKPNASRQPQRAPTPELIVSPATHKPQPSPSSTPSPAAQTRSQEPVSVSAGRSASPKPNTLARKPSNKAEQRAYWAAKGGTSSPIGRKRERDDGSEPSAGGSGKRKSDSQKQK